MKVYGFNSQNTKKVVLTMEELGLDYEYHPIALNEGAQKKPEHLARNPLGKVPVLEHNGNYLIESNAIAKYLCRISDNRLYSADPLEAALIDQFIDTTTLHVGRWINVYFWEEVIRQNIMGEAVDSAALEEADGYLAQLLPFYESTLDKTEFLCGSQMTLADVIATCYFQIQDDTSFSFSSYGNISRWFGQMAERPALLRANEKASKVT